MTAPEITIPDEAIERVAKRLALLCEDDAENWEDYTDDVYEICLAMLKAWPKAGIDRHLLQAIILPLPKEPEA